MEVSIPNMQHYMPTKLQSKYLSSGLKSWFSKDSEPNLYNKFRAMKEKLGYLVFDGCCPEARHLHHESLIVQQLKKLLLFDRIYAFMSPYSIISVCFSFIF